MFNQKIFIGWFYLVILSTVSLYLFGCANQANEDGPPVLQSTPTLTPQPIFVTVTPELRGSSILTSSDVITRVETIIIEVTKERVHLGDSPILVTPTQTPGEDSMENQPGGSELQKQVDLAQTDLAERLAVDPAQIKVEEANWVVWPDAGLGCPQPEMAYKAVRQEGVQIKLNVDGKVYYYHGGGGRPPFLCEKPARGGDSTPLSPPGFND